MNSLISIIIPVFNRPTGIINALNSIKIQSQNEQIETIVIDDSLDETTKNIKEFITYNKNIKIIHIKPKIRAGISKSRNIGISIASSKIVLFLDSDDSLMKGAIEKVIRAFNNNKSLILYFGSSLYKSGKTQNFQDLKMPMTGEYKDYLKSLNQPEMLSAFRINKKNGNSNFYFYNFSGFEFLLYLKILKKGGTFFRDPELIRIYDDQGTDRLCISNPQNYINMRDGYIELIKNFGFDLIKHNFKIYLLFILKIIIYNRLIKKKLFNLSNFFGFLLLPLPRTLIQKLINIYRK